MGAYLEAALHGVRRVATSQPSDEELAESVMNAVLDAQAKALGIKGWWIEADGYGDVTVWQPNPERPDFPIPVTAQHSVQPEHWAILAALIPAKDSQRRELLSCTWGGCERSYDPAEDDADELFCSEKCRRDEADDNEKTAMAAEHDPCEGIEEPS